MRAALLLSALLLAPGLAMAQHEHHQHQSPSAPESPAPAMEPAPVDPDLPVYTFEDLERRARERNPAFAQAEAAIRGAEARRVQAGLWPNPVVGYTGEDIPLEDGRDGGSHGVFVAQEIPLGGKLRLSRDLLAQDLTRARAAAESQRRSLTGGLRSLYARTLAAQLRLDVRERLTGLAQEAVEVTSQLFNVGAADAPDQIAIQNEASLAEAELSAARVELDQLWFALRAAVGDPDLAPGRLEGDLAADLPDLDREEWRRRILEESPELSLASTSLARAEAALARQRAERIPDLEIEAGVRDNRERAEEGGRIGREGFADVGIRLPLWNRNQGGIAAAEAELAAARLEAERVRLRLEERYANVYSRYRQAAERARTYQGGVLERARQAWQLYLGQYQQMQAAYPQVLVSQRTLFQLEEDYTRALARAWEAAVEIQTLLATAPSTMMNDSNAETLGSGH